MELDECGVCIVGVYHWGLFMAILTWDAIGGGLGGAEAASSMGWGWVTGIPSLQQ